MSSTCVVSGYQIFFIGALAIDEAPQVGGEIPLSLKIGVSKSTPHNSLEHYKKT